VLQKPAVVSYPIQNCMLQWQVASKEQLIYELSAKAGEPRRPQNWEGRTSCNAWCISALPRFPRE